MTFPFDKEIILENSVALLRPMQAEDFEHLQPIAFSEKDLLQYSPWPIHSEELLQRYIQRAVGNREKKMRYTFSIFDKRKNAYAGSTSFLNIADADERLEIGATWIGKDFQKTGLNRNVKYLMLDFAFGKLQAERVEFRTDERNSASRTAIEKIGGKLEGILRRHTLMHDGFRRNTACYSILKSEWQEMKQNFLKC